MPLFPTAFDSELDAMASECVGTLSANVEITITQEKDDADRRADPTTGAPGSVETEQVTVLAVKHPERMIRGEGGAGVGARYVERRYTVRDSDLYYQSGQNLVEFVPRVGARIGDSGGTYDVAQIDIENGGRVVVLTTRDRV